MKKKAEEAEKAAKERAKKEAEEAEKAAGDARPAIYEKDFRLVVPLETGFKQARRFQERLEQIENLKIEWTGGSVDEGIIIAVSAQKPMNLIRFLNEMSIVDKVDRKGKNIVVVLKPSTIS